MNDAIDPIDVVAAKTAHLTQRQLDVAFYNLGVSASQVDGPWVGAIVGEMPSASSHGTLPLFPWPSNSSGGRLLRLSGMTAGQYLGRFVRKNLHAEYQHEDDPETDRQAAETIKAWALREGSMTMILLGERVAKAFGLEGVWRRKDGLHPQANGGTRLEYMSIAHPRHDDEYLDPQKRQAARAAMLYAAGLLAS